MRRCRMFVSALTLVAAAVAVAPPSAHAQAIDPQCGNATIPARITQDACQKALDLFQLMAPQLGLGISGGNAVLGEHSALRGLGHFSLGLRANVVRATVPRVDEITPAITGAVASDYGVDERYLPVPTVDAAIGLFRGIPFGGTYAFGVDALVNVAYVPEVTEGDVSVDVPDGSVKLGFGARVGLLQETFVTPGVSLTYLRRDLPVVNVVGSVGDDRLVVRDVDVQTTAWRVVAGKNLSLLSLSIGAGQDRYETSAAAQVTVERQGIAVTSPVVTARQELTRTTFFGNVAFNLGVFRLVGEVGRASGGDVSTYNSFSGNRPTDGRTYGSLGLRFSW